MFVQLVKDIWFTPRRFGSSNLSHPTRDTWRIYRYMVLVKHISKGTQEVISLLLKTPSNNMQRLQTLYGSNLNKKSNSKI